MAPPRDVDRILAKLDAQDTKLDNQNEKIAQIQTTQAVLVQKAEDAAESRAQIFRQTEELKDQQAGIEARVVSTEYAVAEVKNACLSIEHRVGSIEVWKGNVDNARLIAVTEKGVFDRISGKVWAVIAGAALVIGGLAANIIVKLLEGRGII